MFEMIVIIIVMAMIGGAGFIVGRDGGWHEGYNAALVKHDIHE